MQQTFPVRRCPRHRRGRIFGVLAVLIMVGGTGASAAGIEYNTNRMGSDYRSFWQSQPNPQICRNACDREQQCQAWTYVKPGVQGHQARCWLKHSVPGPSASQCCDSGVKGAGVAAGSRVINNPMVGGVALDVCLRWGTDCGKPAADAYCRQAGYSYSVNHRVRHDSPPTRVIGSGQTCSGSFCDRISQVVCAGARGAGSTGSTGATGSGGWGQLPGAWGFGRVNGAFLCNITLTNRQGRYGNVIRACHQNESFWRMQGGYLVFVDNRGRVTSRFSRHGSNYWAGPYVLEPQRGITHYIRR